MPTGKPGCEESAGASYRAHTVTFDSFQSEVTNIIQGMGCDLQMVLVLVGRGSSTLRSGNAPNAGVKC